MQPRHHRVAKPVVLHARVATGTGGGPEKTILSSPRHLGDLGYDCGCVYLHPPGDPGFEQLRLKAEQLQAPLHSIHDRGALDWRVIPRALTLCRRLRVAVWHGHDYKSNLLGLILNRFWKMRLVTTVHGWVRHTKRTPLYYAIDRFCLKHYEVVVAVSEDLERECLASGVAPARCRLIENAIDTVEFSRTKPVNDAKRELGLSQGRWVIGAVGRLSPEKGFDSLLRVSARLVREGYELEVVIVGEGDQEAELRALAERLGLGERARLLGYRSDVRAVYEAMDVFVLSSLREGLPNVLLEAQSLEVPVVATRIAGVPRLIEHDRNGLLIEPGSDDAIATALRRILQDHELRRSLARNGRQVIEDRYSFAKRMRKMAAIYDQLLQ